MAFSISNDADEIMPGLWLGNRRAALNDNWLREQNISVVVNCTKDIPFSGVPIKRYRVPVDDNLELSEINNMTLWAPEIAFKILQEYFKGNKILIHCYAGIQRSAAAMTFVLLVLKYPTNHQTVMKFIQSRRPVAFYNQANFLKSIQEFERYYYSSIPGAKIRMEVSHLN
jgi:hypothetical protein